MRVYVALLLGLICLSACSGPDTPSPRAELTPMPSAPVDPIDAVLKASIEHFLRDTGAPASSLYSFTRDDLNGDQRRDALVLFENPYGYWCGLYGCTMLVMQATDSDFNLINSVEPVRGPLLISDTKTNGWNDIIIRVSGRWDETKDVALQYNGAAYPPHPSELPPYMELASITTKRVFKNQ
jgi:hypothetical protein